MVFERSMASDREMVELLRMMYFTLINSVYQFIGAQYGEKEVRKFLEFLWPPEFFKAALSEGMVNQAHQHDRFQQSVGSTVEIEKVSEEELVYTVKECGIIASLKGMGVPIYANFCLGCKVHDENLARVFGYESTRESGDGKCRVTHKRRR